MLSAGMGAHEYSLDSVPLLNEDTLIKTEQLRRQLDEGEQRNGEIFEQINL